MREATPLGLKRLQCRAWELSYASLDVACKVVFSNRLLVSDAISRQAYKAVHAAQIGVHEIVEQQKTTPLVAMGAWLARGA